MTLTAQVLVSGSLFRPPEQRTSKAGKPFTTATIRAKDGEASQWWKVVAFSESAQAELSRLSDGDALSIQGALKVETYERDGATKLSLSVIAEHVIALRQPPRQRERKPADAKPPMSRRERIAGVPDPSLNDDVPF
jgi:single-stranded DNA-binding protein